MIIAYFGINPSTADATIDDATEILGTNIGDSHKLLIKPHFFTMVK